MDTRKYLKHASIFVLVGIVIYFGVYLVAEKLVLDNTKRNRFFLVKTTPVAEYDYVILGASHAMILSFEDMNDRLEQMTGKKILNLATLGSGIVPNRLFLDYFLMKHKTKAVVYILDAGPFMKKEANETRLKDVAFMNRAPFDPELVKLLWSYYSRGLIEINTVLDYVLGFSKIANEKRFSADIHEMELIFNRTYRPNMKQIKARIDSTDPAVVDEKLFNRYMSLFSEMIDSLRAQNIQFIACRPALPKIYYDNKPNEKMFEARMQALLTEKKVPFADFVPVMPDYKFYFDTDHLNRSGVPVFFENHFKSFLVENAPK
jgi:hypothetical protein